MEEQEKGISLFAKNNTGFFLNEMLIMNKPNTTLDLKGI